eukprot:CAMPEP_0177675284 /NCGR_PEP_ID=MMETSP0447-20121125/27100_1 /TAXON_ID=0 /ORGANISM="Stygamoeba regulata, Strain BSH-02190019" /LENGTH=37 /DNA_ID= /DNA_START= /DNA_END= /DNA_ORIENTATION=
MMRVASEIATTGETDLTGVARTLKEVEVEEFEDEDED